MAAETMVLERTSHKTRPPGTARKPRYGGLCSTCSHAPHCTYPRDPQRAVMHCDEFEGIELGPAKPPAQKTQPAASAAVPQAVEYKGLCGNCDNHDGCTYPRPERGVWHCEEYQ